MPSTSRKPGRRVSGVGAIATCAPLRLELLRSARDVGRHELLAEELAALPDLDLRTSVLRRAEDVQALLAQAGHHRGPTPVDLLVATAAEVHGATLLHYDRRFDLIVGATGQPAEWLAPRGSLDRAQRSPGRSCPERRSISLLHEAQAQWLQRSPGRMSRETALAGDLENRALRSWIASGDGHLTDSGRESAIESREVVNVQVLPYASKDRGPWKDLGSRSM